jgi:carnosine N-methyltransferase
VDDAILANAAFLNQIVVNPEIFENGGPASESEVEETEEDGDGLGESLSLDESRDEGVHLLLASPMVCRTKDPQTLTAGLGDREGSSAAPHSHPRPHGHSHDHPHTHAHGTHSNSSTGPENTRRKRRPTDFDMDKVRSTLKQLVRDWSEEVRRLICPLKVRSLCQNAGKR